MILQFGFIVFFTSNHLIIVIFIQALSKVPTLNTLLSSCPNLHTLKIDFRITPLTISPLSPEKFDLSRLRKLSAGLCLSKKAFIWLWKNAKNLEEILISSITSSDAIDAPFNDGNIQDRFNRETLSELITANPMKHLRKFNVHIYVTDIGAATFLVESLRKHATDIKEIGKLIIKVQLPQQNYGNQEEILEDVARLMQQMRKFKVSCEAMDDPVSDSGRIKVKWDWEKVGIFQSFAEIEQLNAMVEPINVE